MCFAITFEQKLTAKKPIAKHIVNRGKAGRQNDALPPNYLLRFDTTNVSYL